MKPSATQITALIFFFSLALLLPLAYVLPPGIMECRNWIVAREMVSEGNWIFTTMNGFPRYEKPPFPTWLSAISGCIFGMDSHLALRLPAVLCGAFLSVLIHKFGVLLQLGASRSFVTGGIAATSLYCILIIFEAPWDIFAHTAMLAAIYFGFLGVQPNSKNRIWLVFGSAACAAISFLSKGPIGLFALFLPLLLSGLYLQPVARQKLLRLTFWVLIVSIFGAWWYFYIRFADPETFLEVAKVESSRWSNYNVRPFYYYWSFFVQSGIWALVALGGIGFSVWTYFRNTNSHPTVRNAFFVVVWCLLAVLLLSCIPEKKSRYLMPVLIPLALSTGYFVQSCIAGISNIKSAIFRGVFHIHFWILGVVGILFPVAVLVGNKQLNIPLAFVLVAGLSWLFVWMGFKAYQAKKRNLLFLLNLVFVLFLVVFGSMLYNDLSYQSPKDKAISELKNRAKVVGDEIISLEHLSPELNWAMGGITPVIELNEWEQIREKDMILMVNDELEVPPNVKKQIRQRASDSLHVQLDYRLFGKGEIHPRKRAWVYFLEQNKS